MQQPLTPKPVRFAAPSFHLTEKKFLDPKSILLATAAASALLCLVSHSLGSTRLMHLHIQDSSTGRAPTTPANTGRDSPNDDPSQVDTVYLGDPADASLPARSRGYVDTVHPFIVVHLPRFGSQLGLIPDTPAGHLLFEWLVAFNHADGPALRRILPMEPLSSAAFEQIELRKKTSGLDVISAAEVRPGILVFRLRDQTPSQAEILGTLHVCSDTVPRAIATFSLRAVQSSGDDLHVTTAATLVALPERPEPAVLGPNSASGSPAYR